MKTSEKIIKTAEPLFFSRGFRGVALQDICNQLKIKPASLYYHFPRGKEQIYVEVLRLRTAEFKNAIQEIAFRNKNLRAVLTDFGLWYISQPPMNMTLIADMDMPFLSSKGKKIVTTCVGDALFSPLGQLFSHYSHELKPGVHPHLLVATFNLLLFSIHASVKMGGNTPESLVHYIVDVFLDGVAI